MMSSFPKFSNREDFYQLIAINDDDTGDPLNLASIVSLANPNGFTGTNWTITDGTIVTTSASSITIPGYPIGNELTALTFTDVPGHGFLVGDQVSIVDNAGNASVFGYVTSYVSATGVLVVQVGVTFQFEIRREHQHLPRSDWSASFDWGHGGEGPLITASLGNMLTIADLGILVINIPEATMRQLHHRSYIAALTVSDTSSTRQVFISRLPIQYGGVTN
jgi:hypothetical protein